MRQHSQSRPGEVVDLEDQWYRLEASSTRLSHVAMAEIESGIGRSRPCPTSELCDELDGALASPEV